MTYASKTRNSIQVVLKGLGWPVLIGLSLFVGLALALQQRWWDSEFLRRYICAHPINYSEAAMFLVGFSALLLKAKEVVSQYVWMQKFPELESEIASGNNAAALTGLASRLETTQETFSSSWVWQRLQAALSIVKKQDNAEGLGDELKYLAETEASKQQDSYGLVRLLVWAIPMLGFLGTVIGISDALGGLSVGDSQNFEGMLGKLRSSLYVAFDTTAIALVLSITLMFIQFVLDKFEGQLLGLIDARVESEMFARFQPAGKVQDPVLRTLDRLARATADNTEVLVQKQATIWQDSITQAQTVWEKAAHEANEVFVQSLEIALTRTLDSFTKQQLKAHERWTEVWSQQNDALQSAFNDNADRIRDLHDQFVRHSEIMARALEASTDILKLEDALNRNVASLKNSSLLEETLSGLAAAVHLLNTRLAQSQPEPETRIELRTRKIDQAA